MKELNIGKFEEKIGVNFKNKDLLLEALTHRSYLNENTKWRLPHNERLEFLGDAVLELAVTRKLFSEFPEEPEGWLTVLRSSLVNYQNMARSANDIGLASFVLLSRGEKADSSKAHEVILANAIEAVIGAIYLDSGFELAEKFVNDFVLVRLPEILKTRSYKDPKSELQEIIQEKLKVTPTYRVLQESGPAHDRVFEVGVFFGDDFVAQGQGSSKQEAETDAAKTALKNQK